ncbi:hypothetical protein ACFSYH_10205 [Populibacterium corticicola]|uniref:IPT/TIG domain-containing protein n=1 Tax=Populibacterium corticicola TaxID=1812826 RepID=A0ABW5XI27_9MICO
MTTDSGTSCDITLEATPAIVAPGGVITLYGTGLLRDCAMPATEVNNMQDITVSLVQGDTVTQVVVLDAVDGGRIETEVTVPSDAVQGPAVLSVYQFTSNEFEIRSR